MNKTRHRSPWPLDLTYRLDMRTIPYVVAVEKNGMKVDPGKLEKLGEDFEREIEEATVELNSLTGRPDGTNYNSSQVVQEIVFGDLGLRPAKTSDKTGRGSADKKFLEAERDKLDPDGDAWKIIQGILDVRSRKAFRGAWIDKGLSQRDSDDTLHSRVRHTRVVSGRWSMAEPFNFMAIPHEGAGHRLREAFVPLRSDWLWWKGDYSALEMRDAGGASGDARLIEVFGRGGDIHTENAARAFQIEEGEVDKWAHRYPMKRTGFGVLYGITPQGLVVHMPREQRSLAFTTWIRDEWFKLHGGVWEYIQEVQGEAEEQAYVQDLWGRLKWLPEMRSVIRGVKAAGLRESFSLRIQGNATGHIKIPMAFLFNFLAKRGLEHGEHYLAMPQVHDELNFSVHPSMIEYFDVLVCQLMTQATTLGTIPLVVESAWGENWSEAEEGGNGANGSTAHETVGRWGLDRGLEGYCDVNWGLLGIRGEGDL